MTNDEKLALLTETENEGWRLLDLQVEDAARRHCLELIERSQRIRAGLGKVVFQVTNPYKRSSSGDEGY